MDPLMLGDGLCREAVIDLLVGMPLNAERCYWGAEINQMLNSLGFSFDISWVIHGLNRLIMI